MLVLTLTQKNHIDLTIDGKLVARIKIVNDKCHTVKQVRIGFEEMEDVVQVVRSDAGKRGCGPGHPWRRPATLTKGNQ